MKIFENHDFGYKHITVERPLRVNFAVTDQRVERLKNAMPFVALATSKKRKNASTAKEQIERGERFQRDYQNSRAFAFSRND